MTPAERKLFKEAVIMEYKIKHKQPQKKYNNFARRLKQIAPLNITIGFIACLILIFWKGWGALFNILLWSIIWITLISTVASALLKPN